MGLEGILLDFVGNQVINEVCRIAVHRQKLRPGQPGPAGSVPAHVLARPGVLHAHPGRTHGILFRTRCHTIVFVCMRARNVWPFYVHICRAYVPSMCTSYI